MVGMVVGAGGGAGGGVAMSEMAITLANGLRLQILLLHRVRLVNCEVPTLKKAAKEFTLRQRVRPLHHVIGN